MFLSRNHLLLNCEKIVCFRSSTDAIPSCRRIAVTETVEVPPESEIIVRVGHLLELIAKTLVSWRLQKVLLTAVDF